MNHQAFVILAQFVVAGAVVKVTDAINFVSAE